MKCPKCKNEMLRGQSYKDRGRRRKTPYHCLSCGNLFIKKTLIANVVRKRQ